MRVIIHFKKSSKIRELSNLQIFSSLSLLGIIFIGLITLIIYLSVVNFSSSLAVENKKLKSTIKDLNIKLNDIQLTLSRIYESEKKLQIAAGITLDDYAVGGSEEFNITNLLKSKELKLTELNNKTDELIEKVRYQKERLEILTQKLNEKQELAKHIPAIVPMEGVFSDHGFGMRKHPILRVWRMHEGIDILGLYGTPVYAAGAGIVKFVGWNGGLGLCVTIDHGFGYETTYGHLSRANVREGQRVSRFQKIGECGSTGLSTGPHLHYEVTFNGVKQNPVYYFFK